MRCIAYCTAASYDIPRLFAFLQMSGTAQLYRDVIHFEPKSGGNRELFYFPFGVAIFWGYQEAEEKEILAGLKKFERESVEKIEIDEFSYLYGDRIQIEQDEITLPKKGALTKLSLSYAIGQSVKLTVFEETVATTIEHSKQIPKDLAMKGKIPLSRKEASKKMGELFLERNYINLHTDILDTPEFFWEHPELEPFYRRMILYLDMSKRVELLNRRLNLMHELFEMLGNELNHQQTWRLEITIVGLIVIEVILALLHDLFHVI